MTFDELIEIYELTYKYQMLKQHKRRMGGWMEDEANRELLKIQSRLLSKLDDAMSEMIDTYDGWLSSHYEAALNEMYDYVKDIVQSAENAAWGLSKTSGYEQALIDLSQNLEEYGIDIGETEELVDKIDEKLKKDDIEGATKLFSDFLWDDVWSWVDGRDLAEIAIDRDEEYQGISNHKDELEEAWYGRGRYDKQKKPTLDDMLTQFHIGLHIAHHNGIMAEHFISGEIPYPGEDWWSTNFFLKKMSEGLYVDRWDRELARIIGRSYDPREEDTVFIDWSERGRIKNPGAIPAPEYHIFIQE